MAQAAHAATAVQHLHASHPDMKRYLAGEDERGWEVMRKAVLEVGEPLCDANCFYRSQMSLRFGVWRTSWRWLVYHITCGWRNREYHDRSKAHDLENTLQLRSH